MLTAFFSHFIEIPHFKMAGIRKIHPVTIDFGLPETKCKKNLGNGYIILNQKIYSQPV